MSQSIHGHEVMEMMLEEGGHFTRASLREAIEARFGADARFHTCSASEMDAEALISLLAKRGKFIESEQGIQTRADKICNHG
ncbi:YecH family metal-binding protein [Aeromonas sp. Marseille-Q5825]|uniref:YecH family metal-binding protein n=1 Tax=Aeromonas sp. Marseille-Q5825 TaxID=2972767 RepID=UPI0021C6C5D8|nr:YecH family metal-binding protein [Aeromonas sp. Marseille-Q5825]